MVKFLVVRFSSIGDIVLTTPAVRCLKKQVEGAEVHYLTKAQYACILKENPYIDKIHILESDYGRVIRSLKEEKFDYIIDLHRNLRTYRLKSELKRISFAYDKLNFQKWLLVNLKINNLPDIHIVDRYFDAVKAFSVSNDMKGTDYFIPEEEEMDPASLFPKEDTSYNIIVAGGGHNTKQIPADELVQIIDSLSCQIVLLGGPEDAEKANRIETRCKRKIHNLAGKLSINQSASIIKQANWILTPDTGMMHIASAFGKRIFSIWGNTVPQFGMYAWQSHHESEIFEVANLSCRPCSKIGFRKCPRKHFRCMKNQNYNTIINTLRRF